MNEEKALNIHKRAIIIDCLAAVERPPERPDYLEETRLAGVTAINASIVGDDRPGFRETIDRISSWYQGFRKYTNIIMAATRTSDIETAKSENKVAVVLGLQSTKCLENNLDLLDIFYNLGVRIIQLTYQRKCWVGNGCGERTDDGLSKFGIEVVRRMNELGILVDLSHCGSKTTMEAIKFSEKPVAFTHSNPRALRDTVRNKTDEQIKMLAGKGGVMGLNVFAPFCKGGPSATLDDFIDMIDYLVNLVGVDHIGLGFDYFPFMSKEQFAVWKANNPEIGKGVDYETKHLKQLESIHFLPELTKGLVRRGYSEKEIEKILGQNFLNLLKEVWRE